MFLNTGQVGGAAVGIKVQTPLVVLANVGTSAPVYSGIRWDSDGKIYRMSNVGGWQYTADWLLSGAASSYYLWRSIVSGTLDTDDGDGNQLNTGDLDYSLSHSTEWFDRTASVTFSISDDVGGTNILDSRTYDFSAFLLGDGEPPF